MSDIYEKNLDALKGSVLYDNLKNLNTNKDFDVYIGDDSANINIIDKRDFSPMFKTNPVDEVMALFEELKKYSLYPFLYFYGLSNGVIYKLLLANQTHRRIVVIEPELEIIYIVLNVFDLSNELKANRLKIYQEKDVDFSLTNMFFSNKDAKIFSKVYDLTLILPFYEKYKDNIIHINQLFIRAIEHNIYAVGNDSVDSLLGLKNHIKNLEDMVKSPKISSFVKDIKTSELAILVATGPSLTKQLPLLKKIQDYVTIFSVDASLPILEKWGIQADVTTSIERVKETAKFYKEISEEYQKNLSFALNTIVDEELIKNVKNKKNLSLPMRPFGYCKFLGLDEWGYIGLGMSSANNALELIYHSGFKRCIIIGQDLAYSDDGYSHAKGAVYGENEIPLDKSDVLIEKYGGGGFVKSRKVWKIFLNFYEKDIDLIKDELEVVNATEGGVRIKGTKEESFLSICENILKEAKKKKKIFINQNTKKEIKKGLEVVKDRLNFSLNFAKKIKSEVEEVFLDLTNNIVKIDKLKNENKEKEIDYEKVDLLINKIDNIKSYFLEDNFQQLFNDLLQSYIVHQELELAKIQVRVVLNDEDKKKKNLDWIYAHKPWLFYLAGGIDSIIVIIEENNNLLT